MVGLRFLSVWASWWIKLRLDVAMRDLELERDIRDLHYAKESDPSAEKATSIAKSSL
jgi:hypothetical protein